VTPIPRLDGSQETKIDSSEGVTYHNYTYHNYTIGTSNMREGSMLTKLTLRMDDDLIKSAKEYSAQTGKSVSRIVADLFEMIKNEKIKGEEGLTPAVRSLKGVLKGKQVDEKDYHNYLEEKYL
jgi:hypothetical protein